MRLSIFFVLFPALIATLSPAAISIENPQQYDSGIVEAAVNILQSCYAGRIKTLGLVGKSAGAISKILVLREFVTSVILIDDNSKTVKKSVNGYKLPAFVITVTSPNALAGTLLQMKNSVWWNDTAFFLLLHWPVSQHGCSQAYEVLWEAWKMHRINTNFMCVHPTRGRLIYTYNPYASKADVPSQVEKTYEEKNNPTWSSLVRVYQEDQNFCDAVDFDMTKEHSGEI